MALVSICFVAIIVSLTLVALRIKTHAKERASRVGKPLPGPKGLPIIGNVHELPSKCSWMKFHEWGEKYGPIYQVNLAGQNHVWISRDNIARELLGKRSAIYSDRPFIPGLKHDNRTSGQYLPLMSKNEIWTRQRKFAKQIMDSSMKQSFFGYPEMESIRLLFELMSDPSGYNNHMETFVARVTSRLAWGTSRSASELKQRAGELLIGVSPSGALGNKLPFLMSLPEWLVPAKAWELRRNRTEQKFFETMQNEVRESSGPSCAKPQQQSWMSMFLDNSARWGFASDLEGAYAVGMHGIAGALTIAAPMQAFCLAMCHNPQYQPILHEEIDRILGDRMIEFADMPNMPVLRSFIRETLRWRPPVPTGIPHELTEDDIYEDFFIPKGSVIHPLEWSISRDPAVFINPDDWNPMRWLDPESPAYQQPLTQYPSITGYSQFGYGRRTCQGMGITEADLFVGLGSIAWLFRINLHGHTQAPERNAVFDHLEAHSEVMNLHGHSESTSQSPERSAAFEYFQAHSEVASTVSSASTNPTCEVSEPRAAGGGQTDFMAFANDSGIHMPEVDEEAPEKQGAAQMAELSGSLRWVFEENQRPSQEARPSPKLPYELDPTMDFSTLLIAKPMPFKFEMSIRNATRAKLVARQMIDLKMAGEFEEPRVFWKGGNEGDAEFGWGKVFS